METKKQKRLLGLPSWGLSLIIAFVLFVFLLFLGYLLRTIFSNNESMGEAIAYIIWAVLITIACFVICRNNPKSVWYVPVFCNIFSIITAIIEPNFWITPLWMLICGGWFLSVVGAIGGAIVGNRSS